MADVPLEAMTLRDLFALAAMHSFIATEAFMVSDMAEIAEDSYEQADAMLKARNK